MPSYFGSADSCQVHRCRWTTFPPPDPWSILNRAILLIREGEHRNARRTPAFPNGVWPQLDEELRQDWHQVEIRPRKPGDDPSWTWLTERFTVHGFVDDLARLFQLGDACVMPSPVDASGHAKYAMCMAYGMVNLGYRAAFLSQPELVHGENCLAPETTEDVVEALRSFRADPALRRRLAEASRATYESKYSFEAQLPKFEELIRSCSSFRPRSLYSLIRARVRRPGAKANSSRRLSARTLRAT